MRTRQSVKPRSKPLPLLLIQRFSKPRRNDIRGALAEFQTVGLTEELESRLRNNAIPSDMATSAELVEAPQGLRGRKVKGLTQKELWYTYETPDRSLEMELAYACGFLNSWKDQTKEAIKVIQSLSQLASVDPRQAWRDVYKCAEEWGASRYICYKIAYLDTLEKTSETEGYRAEIEKALGHRDSPALMYSALENIKPSISLFSVARRHTNILKSKAGKNFRRYHSLSNIVATPLSETDAASFLHRATRTSLIDTVHAIWVILNLSHKLPKADTYVRNTLSPELYEIVASARDKSETTLAPNIIGKVDDEEGAPRASLKLYRASAAFAEIPRFCHFRNEVDGVIGLRLIQSLSPEIPHWPTDCGVSKDEVLLDDSDGEIEPVSGVKCHIDSFYRTYLFLRFIQNAQNLSLLSESELKYIFDKTTELDALLTERELETMHLNSSEETRALVSVMALALYRGRTSDPDVDFEYRTRLEDYLIEHYNGKTTDFIEHLTEETPQVAHYIATSLSETTLQKMYRLIHSPREASDARRDILFSIGFSLNKIDYIIEAEAIDTRNKVSKLRQYFDTSRMFVDSVAMKEWLAANPSAYTEQYKELLPKLVAKLSAAATTSNSEGEEIKKVSVVEISSTTDHLIKQIVVEAFKEFCTNREFGIESYLGRRIRHNTLYGVMTDPVDTVLSKPQYHPIIVGTRFGEALDDWQAEYRRYIDRIRSESLQFWEVSKPNALFRPELDLTDSTAQRGISILSKSLFVSGTEMLPDLIIAFCWQQISPQLNAASRNIKFTMAGDVKALLEQRLGRFDGQEEQRIFNELNEAVEEVFSKVASWFRLPETGFVPATVGALCNIIDMEVGRQDNPTQVNGNALDTEYTGISVHRLYDCLNVLVQNAVKHGSAHSPIYVSANSTELEDTKLHDLKISVVSKIDQDDVSVCVERINEALTSTETGKDMVTEGYSGLKKLKFITKSIEGRHTVEYASLGTDLEISFRMKVEVSDDEVLDEEYSAH